MRRVIYYRGLLLQGWGRECSVWVLSVYVYMEKEGSCECLLGCYGDARWPGAWRHRC